MRLNGPRTIASTQVFRPEIYYKWRWFESSAAHVPSGPIKPYSFLEIWLRSLLLKRGFTRVFVAIVIASCLGTGNVLPRSEISGTGPKNQEPAKRPPASEKQALPEKDSACLGSPLQ